MAKTPKKFVHHALATASKKGMLKTPKKGKQKTAKFTHALAKPSKASLSRARGHKPVALLKLYHSKMERNLGKLENVIHLREQQGE